MFAFALQNTLLVRYARRMDGLSLAFYRNASFTVTLLPLLIGSGRSEIGLVISRWPVLLLSAVSGGIALWCIFTTYNYIPIGTARAFNRAITTTMLIVISWIVLHETLSFSALLLCILIIASAVWLGIQRNHMDHLDNRMVRGVLLVMGSAVMISVTKFCLALLSRSSSPLVAAYFWEISIAAAALIIIELRKCCGGERIQHIPIRDVLGIALCASPTLVGTGAFAIALSMGPISITETIGTGALILSALFAHWMYGEKLMRKQWVAIGLIAVGIVGLKFV